MINPSHSTPAEKSAGVAPLSLARRQALAAVQQRRREAAANRVASLRAPEPFASARDFLESFGKLVLSMPRGCSAEIARECEVDTSTATKWLRGDKVPTQQNLDKLVAWWRVNRDRATPMPVLRRGPSGAAQSTALTRLPESVAMRLRRTARLRNLTPIKLAEQILDRHLPSIDALNKESGP